MTSMYLQCFCWHHSVIYFCCQYNVEKCTGLILVINTVVWQPAHFCYYSNNEQSDCCCVVIALQCSAIATPWWYLQLQHLDGTCNCNTLNSCATATAVHNNCVHSISRPVTRPVRRYAETVTAVVSHRIRCQNSLLIFSSEVLHQFLWLQKRQK